MEDSQSQAHKTQQTEASLGRFVTWDQLLAPLTLAVSRCKWHSCMRHQHDNLSLAIEDFCFIDSCMGNNALVYFCSLSRLMDLI